MARIASERDRDAFIEMFEHFAPRLKSFMLRGGADPETAEEIVQEAMLSVWNKAGQFDPARAALSTWVFTIARNRRIDLIRRESKPALDPEEPLLQPSAPVAADTLADEGRRDAALRAAIATLPPEQLDLLHLGFYEGKSHAEIAELRKLPLGTVKSRMRLAFSRLRRVMESFQ